MLRKKASSYLTFLEDPIKHPTRFTILSRFCFPIVAGNDGIDFSVCAPFPPPLPTAAVHRQLVLKAENFLEIR
jgi:hypothetical protein